MIVTPRLAMLASMLLAALVAATPAAANDRGPNLGVAILPAEEGARFALAPGQWMRLAIAVNNLRGTAEAREVTLALDLPEAFSTRNPSPAPTHREGRTLSWALGTLPAGEIPRFVEVDIVASTSLEPGPAPEVVARVASRDAEADHDNNRDVMPVKLIPPLANLVVSSTLDHAALLIGQPTEAVIRVVNIGAVAARSTVLTLTLPEPLALASAEPAPTSRTGRILTWRLGEVPRGGGALITLSLALDPRLSREAAPLDITIEATSTDRDAMLANNRLALKRAAAEPLADLKAWLVIERAERKEIRARIVYGNFGRIAAEPVMLSLEAVGGLEVLGAAGEGDDWPARPSIIAGRLTWPLGRLEPGAAGLFTVRLEAPSAAASRTGLELAITSPVVEADAADNGGFQAIPSR